MKYDTVSVADSCSVSLLQLP